MPFVRLTLNQPDPAQETVDTLAAGVVHLAIREVRALDRGYNGVPRGVRVGETD